MSPNILSALLRRTVERFEGIARCVAGLYVAKRRIESAMHAVANHFESIFRDCPLVLYPQNRGRGKPPFRLRWNLGRTRTRKGPDRPVSVASSSSRKARCLRLAGPLTDGLIHHVGRWNMRATFWDFDRRAAGLNAAMEAVARALDRNLKALRYRLANSPVALPSTFPDLPPFPVPPFPETDYLAPDYPPSLKAALRYIWVIACRLTFAHHEFHQLHARYQTRPAHGAVTLDFAPSHLAPPDGGPVWRILPAGALTYALSHRALQTHGIPRTQRGGLLAYEDIRRNISRSVRTISGPLDRLRARADAAVLAYERGMVSAQVVLPRTVQSPHTPRRGAAGAS